MKKYIFGNLKMNHLPSQTKAYCEVLKELDSKSCKVGVAFPFTSLTLASTILKDSNILIGAQNLHYEEKGSFTGEVSSEMLKESGTGFCIVGHSERRQKFGETNAFINKKIKALLNKGIKVILCVGESLGENENGKTKQVITKQLCECLEGLYENELKSIIIAYEPVWAIGSGKTPNAKQIERVMKNIRAYISSSYSVGAGEKAVLLYGGSVNKENAKSLLQTQGVNGALIGGACTDALGFCDIIRLF